jgi:predicted transcriptional regulator
MGNMAEDSTSKEVDLRLVAEIVGGYVAHNSVSVDHLSGLISEVHRSLGSLGREAPVQEALVPAVPIKRSVQRDYVVCLDCGFRSQMLRRHLRMKHGLDAAAYRARWKLSADHPITAPSYSERRSALAKQLGLGRAPHQAAEPNPSVSEAPPAAKRRGRKPSQPVTTSPEVAAAPAPKRRGRKPRALAAE